MINLKMEQRRDFHNVLLDTLSLLVFVCVCVCVSTWTRGQVQRLGYFQPTLQILPPPLVHCKESSALMVGDEKHLNPGGGPVSLRPRKVHTPKNFNNII